MSVLWLSASAASAGSEESGARPFAARCSLTSSWRRVASDEAETRYRSSESLPGTMGNGGVAVTGVAVTSETVSFGEGIGVIEGMRVVTGVAGVVTGRAGVAATAARDGTEVCVDAT